jgi:predicted aspartyl protease
VARLVYEDAAESVATPLVDAVIGGQPTMLIVDTGATHHVVAGWLAHEIASAVLTPGGTATDHGGGTLTVSKLDGVPLSLSGYGRVDAPALLVLDVPDDLRLRGIGGVLSPQALVRPGTAVVLDLGARTLSELPAPEAARRLEARGMVSSAVRRCASLGAGVLVAAAIVEGTDVGLEIDTGSTTSALSAASELGARLGKLRLGSRAQLTASGVHDVPTVPAAQVALGPVASRVDLELLPRAPPCGEGYPGMDLLGGCALLVSGEGARLWCAPRR